MTKTDIIYNPTNCSVTVNEMVIIKRWISETGAVFWIQLIRCAHSWLSLRTARLLRRASALVLSTRLVSKYVAHLESRLSTQLFNRTTRSVALTDVGVAYLERCRPIVEQIDELEDLVQERQSALAGLIRITAPTGFGSNNLARALAPFMQSHPKVDIDMKLSDSRVALVEEGIDLAVRIGVLRDFYTDCPETGGYATDRLCVADLPGAAGASG